MRLDRQMQIEHELDRALTTFERVAYSEHRLADSKAHDAALNLTGAAAALLREIAEQRDDEEGYRVRMTAHGDGAPIADRYMRAIPSRGDLINADTGTNFESKVPCDVILFLCSPTDFLPAWFNEPEPEHDCGLLGCIEGLCSPGPDQEEEPICKMCNRPYGEHDRTELLCPLPQRPGQFATSRRFAE